ncbi:SCAN domain-containing protein 3-like, partial [Aphis craccivora]
TETNRRLGNANDTKWWSKDAAVRSIFGRFGSLGGNQNDKALYSILVTTLKHISSSNPIKNDIKCNAQEKDADSLDAVINFLRETSFGYHSFFPSHQRSFRVIIKNLHHLKPTYDISEALVTLGHTRGGDHLTSKCSKDSSCLAKCALCGGDHTANFKGCPSFKALRKYQSSIHRMPQKPKTSYPSNTNSNPNPNFKSYSHALSAQLYLRIFEYTTPVFKYLQTNSMDILQAQRKVKTTIKDLKTTCRDFMEVKKTADNFLVRTNKNLMNWKLMKSL